MSRGVRRKSMSVAEEDAFLLKFDEMVEEVTSGPEYEDFEGAMELVRRVMEYNVPGGKQIRGRGVVAAFRALVDEPLQEDINLCYIVGWCIEIFQAAFLTADDLMDNSETRRGKPCWYLVDNNSDLAINDSFLLSGLITIFLDKHFFDKRYYSDLVGLFHDVYLKTSLGQAMDIKCSKGASFEEFTIQQYKKIIHYKTCYYTFFLPVASALIMVGKTQPEDWKAVEELVLEIGLLFQVQDDYLDCYGDPEATGKVGTDIVENKCSWLIVTALEKAKPAHRKILEENYGKAKESSSQNELLVKKVFKELAIEEEYHKFEEDCYASIQNKIRKLSNRIPVTIFMETAEVIYRRNK